MSMSRKCVQTDGEPRPAEKVRNVPVHTNVDLNSLMGRMVGTVGLVV